MKYFSFSGDAIQFKVTIPSVSFVKNVHFYLMLSRLALRHEIQRTFLYPHMAVALRARELCGTIIDIHHLEIKT